MTKKGKTEGATCGDDEVMRQLVRDHLAHKADTQQMMDSRGFVILFKTADVQAAIGQVVTQWEDEKP